MACRRHNGLSPGRCQAFIWTDAGILLIGPLGTNFSEISIAIHTFLLKKNAFENVDQKMVAILSRPQWGKLLHAFSERWSSQVKVALSLAKRFAKIVILFRTSPRCGLSHLRLWRTATACSLVRLYHPAPMLAWCGERSYPYSRDLALTVWLFQFPLARCLFPTAPCHQTSSARKTWILGRRGAARWGGHLGK